MESIQFVFSSRGHKSAHPCNFQDEPSKMMTSVEPDTELLKNFLQKTPIDESIQAGPIIAVHEVNTTVLETSHVGINHTEGGWPKDINCQNLEQTARYRKKIEKESTYVTIMRTLVERTEKYLRQNDAIDICEEYFEDGFTLTNEEPSAIALNVYRDPNPLKRAAVHLSWLPDGPHKLAVAYSNLEMSPSTPRISADSYVWDIENSTKPQYTVHSVSPLVCVEYSLSDSNILLGGLFNGQLALWDTRKESCPVELTPVKHSHLEPAYSVVWLQSDEFFSTSTDGTVLWWDKRNIIEPVERLKIDHNKDAEMRGIKAGNKFGGTCLEYEPALPTKFMIGCQQGCILLGDRKGKPDAEKLTKLFPGHYGPVCRVQRNPFFPKIFLSVGDWTARVWSEDLESSHLICTCYQRHHLTDGCWSPSRPGVFFTTKTDGTLDVWDYVHKQNDPSLTLQVGDGTLFGVRVQECGRLLACGSQLGNVTLYKLSDSLHSCAQSEATYINKMFQRQLRREMFVFEQSQKELVVNIDSKVEDNVGENKEELVQDRGENIADKRLH